MFARAIVEASMGLKKSRPPVARFASVNFPHVANFGETIPIKYYSTCILPRTILIPGGNGRILVENKIHGWNEHWGWCWQHSRAHTTGPMDILSMSTIVYGLATYVFTI